MSTPMTENILAYAETHTSGESPLLAELRELCYAEYNDSSMLSGFVQGRILSMFAKMVRPQAVLEIGTYLGYSAMCFAEGLADGGKVITLDMQEATNRVAREFAARSPYRDAIEFRLGNAIEIIPTLTETFDLVFIDADKPNYSNYYDLVFGRVRLGGFIIADNVLWSGRVAADDDDESTNALRDFNKKVLADGRVSNVLLPVRDGLMVVRKESD